MMMEHGIISNCKRLMHDEIYKEISFDPQHTSYARVDVSTKDGDISIYCDRNGNIASVSHNHGSNNDGDNLAAAIEGCITWDEVMDEYLDDNPGDAYSDLWDTMQSERSMDMAFGSLIT